MGCQNPTCVSEYIPMARALRVFILYSDKKDLLTIWGQEGCEYIE